MIAYLIIGSILLYNIYRNHQNKSTEIKNGIKLSNINQGKGFKIKWKDFKKVHHTCDINVRDSPSCRDVLKELNIEIYDD